MDVTQNHDLVFRLIVSLIFRMQHSSVRVSTLSKDYTSGLIIFSISFACHSIDKPCTKQMQALEKMHQAHTNTIATFDVFA